MFQIMWKASLIMKFSQVRMAVSHRHLQNNFDVLKHLLSNAFKMQL